MSGKRLFVAIDFPESTARLLNDLDPKIRGVRWTPANQMHLTLAFFGAVGSEREALLRKRLATIEFHSFFLPLTGIGTFPPKGSPKIIWIGVGSAHPHLFQIYKRVQEAALVAGLEPELRPWHPHVTLARCHDVSRQVVQPFLRETASFDAGLVKVENFHLYSSKLLASGSVHNRELTVNCGAGL